jgi:uncharacterized membrane protein
MIANKGIKKYLLFGVFCLSVVFSSCQWESVLEQVEPELPPDDEEIRFATDIQPIFTDKCVTCHASTNPVLTAGSAYNNLIDGDYVNTSDPENSVLYVTILSGHPGGSSSASGTERALILRWIEEGAQDN